MRVSKWLAMLAVALVLTANVQSADPPAKSSYSIEGMDDYMPVLTKFLELIAKGEIDKAYGLFGTAKSPQEDPEQAKVFEEIKKSLIVLKEKGGGYRGCEVSAVKPITSRLHKVYVVAAFEAKPMLFTFVMYKPANEWQCRDFDFGTKIDDLVESLALVTDLRKK